MDTLSKQERSERMARIKGKDTKPEMIVRQMLHALGYRYRLHDANLPGKPDLVFKKRKKIVFVHGCYWHQHSDKSCKLSRLPKSNRKFWTCKFQANIRRDKAVEQKLSSMGWQVFIVWECELCQKEQLRNKLIRFLESGVR